MEAVFLEAWDVYTKQVTYNLIMKRLKIHSTEKLSTSATEDAHIDIDSETTADILQLQDLIIKQTLEETKNIHQWIHHL